MSFGMLAFAGAVVVGGTGAFFTDTATSTGNVFTAGSVSLALGPTTHQWLGAPNTNLPSNYFGLGETNNIIMGDLKPGDNGLLTTPVTNGDNDAFMCARVTAVSPNDPLAKIADYLTFRTGTGPGGTMSDILAVVPVGQWFSPAAPALNLPAVPLDADEAGAVALEYCFGDFTPGSALGEGCVVDPNTNYNDAQSSSISLDLEYFVVQQRNNENFTCASLNEPEGPVVTPGNLLSEESAGMRVKAQGGEGIYLGEGDLGVPANRVQASIGSMNNATDEYPFTLAYTAATNEITLSGPNGANLVWDVDNAPATCSAWDALRISVRDSRVDSGLALSNVMLNGDSLGDFGLVDIASNTPEAFWTVTGVNYLADWTVTGDIDIASFTGNEASRMSIVVGCAA